MRWPAEARAWLNKRSELEVEMADELDHEAMMAAFAEQLRRDGWKQVRFAPVAVDLILGPVRRCWTRWPIWPTPQSRSCRRVRATRR